MTKNFIRALSAVGLIQLGAMASATVVYSNDFSTSAGSEWSNNTLATSNGEQFLGQSANGFGNGTDTLTLNGLGGHTSMTVTFDLYIIQSWDGNGPAGGGPDAWGLNLDGSGLILTTFANYSGGGNTQSYPNNIAPLGAGGSFAARTGEFEAGHLGFGDGDFGDATYRLTFTVAHSGSSAVFDFTSYQNQGPGDEGWGLDNVTVETNGAVPEPASMAALGLGVAALIRRRRKN